MEITLIKQVLCIIVNFSKEKLDKLYLICEKYFEAVGDGRPKGFIHVDTRTGKKRRWNY